MILPVPVPPAVVQTVAPPQMAQERLAIRGQLHPREIAGLAAAGFKGIINNRPDGEEPGQPTSAELEAEAKRHGLAYWHIPIVPGQATASDARAFAKALRTTDGRVLAFCRTGSRATKLSKMAREID